MGKEFARRKNNTEPASDRNCVALGGQKVTLTKGQFDRLGSSKICVGGFGIGQKNIFTDNGIGPHVPRFIRKAVWYDEHLSRYELILDDERAKQAYYCRFCGRYMGCSRCLDTSLLSEIECGVCLEYSNQVGWWHHGNLGRDRRDELKTMQAFALSQKKLGLAEALLPARK